MSAPLLEVTALDVDYAGAAALRDVSLSVEAGSIVTVIGANGAGKTTLLNAIMGIVAARGIVRLAGEPLGPLPVETRVAKGLGLVPEKRELFTTMSVEDNLLIGGYRRGAARPAAFEQVLALFPRLRERRRQVAQTLSGGERQMLAMGRALMSAPQLLMLDEPSLGLAPLVTRAIFAMIADLRRQGTAILLVEQNARTALAIADYGYVLENGALIRGGAAAALASDPAIIETYLGIRTGV